jgi:hypothetical protein
MKTATSFSDREGVAGFYQPNSRLRCYQRIVR